MTRPHFLLIVADDLGWSDIGAFGSEIETPHLDGLAARGVRLTNFHASPVCSTTRAMLMTGCDHHEVGLGTMAELLTDAQRGRPGYEGHLNDRAATVAERLRDQGYRTMMSGKWHLGIEGESPPSAKGFEHSFALLQGEHNHFGADQTPESAGPLGPARYLRDGEPAAFPVGGYSSDVFADRMIEFLGLAADERPVFAYLAFTAPHSPLQAPEDLLRKYTGAYDEGPEALQRRRLERMQAMGLGSKTAAAMRGAGAWAELSANEQRAEARKMEVYAAMVTAMDRAIGRVLSHLEATHRLQDTLVLFLSDNGPAGELRETSARWGRWIATHADNALDNVGKATSYVSMGPRWAQAQATPYFLFKRYTTDGGVRTCALAAGPSVAARTACDGFIHAMDIAPTLVELAGAAAQSPPNRIPMRGVSAVRLLSAEASSSLRGDTPVGWEFDYGRGIRAGPWKAVFLPAAVHRIDPQVPAEQWMLFNTDLDPGETQDLSQSEPARLRSLIDSWNRYAADVGVVVR